MGRKKKKNPESQLKPWCWYCDREFQDERTLVEHQKCEHGTARHGTARHGTAQPKLITHSL